MKAYLLTLIIVALCWAKPIYLPISMEIMEEVEQLYQDDKVDLYIEKIAAQRNYPDSIIEKMHGQIEEFFESDLFLETGAAYLTSLFTERELTDVLQAIENFGIDYEKAHTPATRKLRKLLQMLDPYIYRFVNSRVIRR